jgi:hypothetical protein
MDFVENGLKDEHANLRLIAAAQFPTRAELAEPAAHP